jgi:hypothetical protein
MTEKRNFWIEFISQSKKSKKAPNQNDILYKKLKYVEISNFLIAIIVLLLSQFEYELEYFPYFYTKTKTEYRGMGVRIALTLICLVSSKKEYFIY